MKVSRTFAPALAVVLAATPALAQDAAKLVVLPYAPLFGELPQSTGDKSKDLVGSELTASGKFALAELSEGAGGGGAAKQSGEGDVEAAKKEIAAAEALFTKAIKLYAKRKMKPAADTFEKGIAKYLLSFHGAEDFKSLSDAYVGLAMARFRLGDEDQAYKLLDDVVRLDPERTLDGQEFPEGSKIPPLFARFHDKARKAYFEKGRGQVRITSTPAGARVLFDGREVGETPVLAKDVLPGDHFVRVLKPGAGAIWKKVTVVAGEEIALSANLSGEATGPLATVAKNLSQNSLTPEVAAAVKTVGEASKADWVVFGAIRPEEGNISVKSWALRVKDGAITQLADLVFDLEMLGAAIEVFKLASDFQEKAASFQGVALESEIIPFPGATAPATEETFAEVSVTPSSAAGPAAAEEEEKGRSGRRGPVRSVVGVERKPIAPAVEEPAEDEGPVRRRGVRVRGRIGETPPEEKVAEKTEEVKAEPVLEVRGNDEIAEMLKAEEEKKTEEKELSAEDLKLKNTGRNVSSLTPEELARLRGLDEGQDEGSGTGKVLMWSGLGVVGAGAVGALVYFLVSPSTPTSATAHVTWSP